MFDTVFAISGFNFGGLCNSFGEKGKNEKVK
jgi:hypothetical protein